MAYEIELDAEGAELDSYTLDSIKEGEIVDPPEFWNEWYKPLNEKGRLKQWAWCIEAYAEYVRETGVWPMGDIARKRLGELFTGYRIADKKKWNWDALEASFEFQAACKAWGLTQPGVEKDWRKVQALTAVTAPVGGSLNARLRKVGVSRELFDTWLEDPKFAHELAKRSEQNYTRMQFEVNRQVQNMALNGRLDAIKYFNELSGRTKAERAQDVNIRMLLAGIVDILTRNIADPDVLRSVGNELEQFVKRSGVL